MEIVLIRHLAVPGNEKRQYIGRTDEPLSEAAVRRFRQAVAGREPDGAVREEFGMRKDGIYPPVDRVIISPMKRCAQTAALIYPGRVFEAEPRLRECDFGRYEGRTYEELKEEPEYIRWLESSGATAFPEGESRAAFCARCVEGFREQIGRLLRERVRSAAFVVHGGTIMAILDAYADPPAPFYDWQVGNGCGYVGKIDEALWKTGQKIVSGVDKIVVGGL